MNLQIQPPNKICVDKSKITDAGRGVFATTAIKKNELIEYCPVVVVPILDSSNDDRSSLANYFFYFGDDLALALGFGSIYNHSYSPNALYETRPRDMAIEFIAIADIAAGEEVTVNYNRGNPTDLSTPPIEGIPAFGDTDG